MKYLVLLETSGNQRYIFSTNKLRENVGASELTYQIGTKIVLESVKMETKLQIYNDNPSELRKNLLDKSKNPEIGNGIKVEVIVATSGKAILLIDDDENKLISKRIIREVTKNALVEMPGLTVHGAICEVKECEKADKSDEAEKIHDTVGDVHKKLEEIRYQIPSVLQRFQRLPFAAECASSNLPAEKLYVHESVRKKEEEKPHSVVSIIKQEKSNNGKQRLEEAVRKIEEDIYFAKHSNDLDERFEDTKWFAIIHADGNGLGQIFLDFQKHVEAKDGKKYIEKYRKFSLGLDECTIKATAFALKNLQAAYRANRKNKDKDSIEVPAIPLVLGGDDLTIICDGQYAVKFTKDFLNKFVEETKINPKITEVFTVNGKLKDISLGICAGIAIIKPHYPFHQAYKLAEQLLQSAKKSKNISSSLSALDYHILYDSSGVDLTEIRGKSKHFKVARPYVVSEEATAKNLVDKDARKSDAQKAKDKTFIENHHFSQLARRVDVMREPEKDDANKRKLPNSQLYTLRERLHLGTSEANAFARTIANRYKTFERLYIDKNKESLFFEETDDDGKHKLTHFLDAMEIAEFWKGFENGGEK